jgi:hypothetical protein
LRSIRLALAADALNPVGAVGWVVSATGCVVALATPE